ncbi:MAG: flagellar basal body-associated protein FliL [Burkholderiaceae bacterium]|uniref:Flagellar protein FliL n=1 Tax=Herminiimonas contaminans TaxID=1111140 RepID=A0ABS0EQM7_9BURK|nr:MULTISPECIES: flagellar basal body-associated protein FliL [Oxalobacteraceae]MBF8177147.1 flagellar basal body-associated protein FliL [Herminiimonas contaminans]MBX9797903.1 flagellar basal body-associated protein FliL [Burkholderiaceae bacterium]
MATAAKGAKAAADTADKPKKSRLLIIILAALLVLGGGGGAAAWYFLGQKAETHAPKAADAVDLSKPPVFLPMEAFTVNLQPENGEQFLQTSFTLQVSNQAQLDLIKLYMPHVRSRLLLLLSGKKASEILTVDGKNKLSEEIIAVFRQPFTPQGPTVNVTNVLFTSFVVQ